MMKRNGFLLALVPLLASCFAMVRVGPGTVTVRDALSVTSDGGWNRIDLPGRAAGESWTSDGLTLDLLTFFVGLKEGEPLAPAPRGSARKPALFRASMLANEIVELFEEAATQDGSTFKLERLAPAPFAGAQGFRFEFSMLRKSDDVALRGIAWGAVVKERLYLVAFRAPRLHFFAKHAPRAEATARSALIKN